MTTHANCTHPATKAARTACRKGTAAVHPVVAALREGREAPTSRAAVALASSSAVDLPFPVVPASLPAGFSRTGRDAHCYGSHHGDYAKVGRCDRCLAGVVRTEHGKLVDYSLGDYGQVRYACWSPAHTCDDDRVASAARAYNFARSMGQLVKGDRVVVTKGRKLAKGTEGTIFYVATEADAYGVHKVGIRVEAGDRVFLNRDNVRAV